MIAASLLGKLIERIAYNNDANAYKELFLLYHKRLLNFSITITHSKQSAEEVVSDVFLKIWVNRSTLATIENFHLYIYIVTKNLSINRALKEKVLAPIRQPMGLEAKPGHRIIPCPPVEMGAFHLKVLFQCLSGGSPAVALLRE